jgi:hypothetical protein
LAISENLNQIPTDTLIHVLDNSKRRLQRCIDINGQYVEYRLFFSIYRFPRITHSGDATLRVEHPIFRSEDDVNGGEGRIVNGRCLVKAASPGVRE